MSRERLEWTLSLLDRASGPARRVASALDRVRVSQERVAKAPRSGAGSDPLAALGKASGQRHSRNQARIGRELEQLARGSGQVSSAGSRMGSAMGGALLGIAAGAAAALAVVGRLTVAIGHSSVEAADWRNRTEGAFRVLLGDRTATVGLAFQRASQYANRFGLDVREVARQMVQLTAAGFSQSEIPRVMQAAGDLGALEGPQAAERAITAIRQIRAKGVLQMEELQGQLADAGLNVGDVMAEVGRQRGLRGTDTGIGNQVRALISSRRVSSEQGISAIMAVIARRSGGRLGGTLDTQSRGAEAAMNRLRNSWLLLQSNFARSPAFARIIGFIERMAAALDPASATAQRFAGQMDRFFSVLTGAASNIDPVAVLAGVVTGLAAVGSGLERAWPYAQAWVVGFYGPVLSVARTALPVLSRLFATIFTGGGPSIATIQTIAGALGSFAALGIARLSALIFLVGNLFAGLRAWFAGFLSAFQSIDMTSVLAVGGAIVRGLWLGISTAWTTLLSNVAGLGGQLVDAIKARLGIRSPSRVFMQLGAFTAQGMALGIESGSEDVRRAVDALALTPDVGAVGARAAGSLRGAGVGPLQLTVNVTAPEGVDPEAWGAVIAGVVVREVTARTERPS